MKNPKSIMAVTGPGIDASSAPYLVIKGNKDGWEKTTDGVS